MIYLYLFGTCFHFIYVFMIIGNILKSHYLCYCYAFRASHDRNGALPYYLWKVCLPNLRRRVILFRESLCKESASRKAHRHRSYMKVTSGVETD